MPPATASTPASLLPEAAAELQPGLRAPRTAPPCALVIFGGSGDLTRRKLIPALFSLARQHRLAPGFAVIGVSTSVYSDEQFRQMMRQAVLGGAPAGTASDSGEWDSFAARLQYLPGRFDDAATFQQLAQRLRKLPASGGNVLYYLATPPSTFVTLAEQLGRAGLNRFRADGAPPGFTRIVVEKPFGRDLASAQQLNRALHQVFSEDQIFRIDHYLGKETVRNIVVFRFANGIFEPVWNRRYVDHVQVTVAESIGIEKRGRYYEESGALRDMLQNHLLQVLSVIAMEAPVRFAADAVRDEKVKLVNSIRPLLAPGESDYDAVAVRGQYGAGYINGEPVPAYRDEAGVAPDSSRETYVALQLQIDNWRWAGVPFYLRSGKRLPKRVSEVAVTFKMPPIRMFAGVDAGDIDANVLVIRIQPDEGISLRFEAKVPGTEMRLRPVKMDFQYGSSFGEPQPEAYETLLLDAMLGDGMLFARYDMVESAWALTTPLLEYWQQTRPRNFPSYHAGDWGPKEADAFIAAGGRAWRRP